MRIKIFDRVLAAILALIVVAACLLGILLVLNVFAGSVSIENIFVYIHSTWQLQAIITACLAIIIIIAIKILFMGEKKAPPPKDILIKTTENGSVRISFFTIDSLAQKHVRSISYVRDLKSKITSFDNISVSIILRISFMPETNIPEVSEQLQASTKDYIQKYTGILVKEVSVFVDDTSINLNARVD